MNQMRPHRVFLCYRREESPHLIGRMYDALVQAFGAASVFRDVDSIAAGDDLEQVIFDALLRVDVVVAVIDRDWLTGLLDPNDWVRRELLVALRTNTPVVPVLVGDLLPTPSAALPDGLRSIAGLHHLAVRPDPDFHADVQQLLTCIRRAASNTARGNTAPNFDTEVMRLLVQLDRLDQQDLTQCQDWMKQSAAVLRGILRLHYAEARRPFTAESAVS